MTVLAPPCSRREVLEAGDYTMRNAATRTLASLVTHYMAVLAYLTIRPGVVAEAGAGSNYANRGSAQDAQGREVLLFCRSIIGQEN